MCSSDLLSSPWHEVWKIVDYIKLIKTFIISGLIILLDHMALTMQLWENCSIIMAVVTLGDGYC